MFDIGALEIFMIGIVALVVIGPEELPKFLRAAGQMLGKAREIAREFRGSIRDVMDEAESMLDADADAESAEADVFAAERKAEGVTPDMSPEEVTDHIMSKKDSGSKNDGGAS